ncbi:MAG: hypothetical protein AB7H93_12735 [Vicinamibacterales bacterium]
MIGPLVRVTVWLTAALAALASLFWALVSTPESNAWMLALSAILVVVMLLVAGLALDGGIRLWRGQPLRPGGPGDLVWPGLRLLPALGLFALVWWTAGSAQAWVEAARGRITAAIIARTGWADPEVLFTAAAWLTALAAWVAGPLLALGCFGAATRGTAVVGVRRWVSQSLSLRALAAGAALAFALGRFWPWLEQWRIALPPTMVQLVFAGAKIAVGLAALAVVAAGFIRLAAMDPDRGHRGSSPPL